MFQPTHGNDTMASRKTEPPPEADAVRTVVRSFWHGAPLNAYLLLCLRSFVRAACTVEIFTYGRAMRFPDWIVQREAADILPAKEVLIYRNGPGHGSPALHSNLFRFTMLDQLGGWWIDTDVALARGPLPTTPYFFAHEEGHFGNSVLKFPRGHKLLAEGAQKCRQLGANARWGAAGPMLFTALVRRHGLTGLAQPAVNASPFVWSDVDALFDPRRGAEMMQRSSTAIFMHLCWETWRRAGVPDDLGPPEGSFLDLQFRASDLDIRFPARIKHEHLVVWLANSRGNDMIRHHQLHWWWRLGGRLRRALRGAPAS